MSFFNSIKDMVSSATTSTDPTADQQLDEKIFRNSTDQLSPEQLGYTLSDPESASTIDQQGKNITQQQQQQQQQPQQRQKSPASAAKDNKPVQMVEKRDRIHFDGIQESKDLVYDLSKGPRPLLVQPHETRTNIDFFGYFDFVIELYREKYPKKHLPEVNFIISPMVGKPFVCETARHDCIVTPLAVATSEPLLRKIFKILTPGYREDFSKLSDITEALYFSPNRCRFVLAKAFAEAVLGIKTPLTMIKLELLRFFSSQRYYKARLEKESRTDAMAAKLHLGIALGGLEHMTKLHHFYTLYKDDIPPHNDAIFAADRFLNLLHILQTEHNLQPYDAIQRALPPTSFIGNDPTLIIAAANNIIDIENSRQEKLFKFSKSTFENNDQEIKIKSEQQV